MVNKRVYGESDCMHCTCMYISLSACDPSLVYVHYITLRHSIFDNSFCGFQIKQDSIHHQNHVETKPVKKEIKAGKRRHHSRVFTSVVGTKTAA